MRRGSPGVTKRRGLCGESSLQARGTEPCGGSRLSHGTRDEGPAGGAGPSRFRPHGRRSCRLNAPPAPIVTARASPTQAGQLRFSAWVANSIAARTTTVSASVAAPPRGSREPVSSIVTHTMSAVVARPTAMPKPCQPERLAHTRPTACRRECRPPASPGRDRRRGALRLRGARAARQSRSSSGRLEERKPRLARRAEQAAASSGAESTRRVPSSCPR